jgi:hypothetical protein
MMDYIEMHNFLKTHGLTHERMQEMWNYCVRNGHPLIKQLDGCGTLWFDLDTHVLATLEREYKQLKGEIEGKNTIDSRGKLKKTSECIRSIIKTMDGLSEEGFENRYMSDPCFHNGFDSLVEIVMATTSQQIYMQQEHIQNLLKLISENPGLPILPVDCVPSDDFASKVSKDIL